MRNCTSCGCVFSSTKHDTMRICKQCNLKRVISQSPRDKMWRRAKARAAQRGMAFDIDKSDIVIPEFCPVLGIPLVSHSGSSGGRNDSPSLDKIIPELGYVKGNIQVISHLANKMKADASLSQLKLFATWILKL